MKDVQNYTQFVTYFSEKLNQTLNRFDRDHLTSEACECPICFNSAWQFRQGLQYDHTEAEWRIWIVCPCSFIHQEQEKKRAEWNELLKLAKQILDANVDQQHLAFLHSRVIELNKQLMEQLRSRAKRQQLAWTEEFSAEILIRSWNDIHLKWYNKISKQFLHLKLE